MSSFREEVVLCVFWWLIDKVNWAAPLTAPAGGFYRVCLIGGELVGGLMISCEERQVIFPFIAPLPGFWGHRQSRRLSCRAPLGERRGGQFLEGANLGPPLWGLSLLSFHATKIRLFPELCKHFRLFFHSKPKKINGSFLGG